MTGPGLSSTRGKLCTSCHTMRPKTSFKWEHEGRLYCSELCARRVQIPKPRSES